MDTVYDTDIPMPIGKHEDEANLYHILDLPEIIIQSKQIESQEAIIVPKTKSGPVVITADPIIRDLQKESTQMVPHAVRKKLKEPTQRPLATEDDEEYESFMKEIKKMI